MKTDDCDELYISYLFPPSNYVSGITVFKRIVENNKKIDILQGEFNSNNNLNDYADTYINKREYISIESEFDSASFISEYIRKGIKIVNKNYKKIYSRSWLMANHFLACEYKFKHPDVIWTAEFSDPLMYSLDNEIKTFKNKIIDDEEYTSKLNYQINKLNGDFPLIENKSSAFFISEYLVYLFSDKIIFTNENQRKIMLDQFPVDVKEMVLLKSEIKPHPTLDNKYYTIKDVKLDLNDDCINFAYFGSDYYSKRHFESLFYAVEALNHKFKDKIKVYIYINDDKFIKNLLPSDNFIIKKPLEYLDFLNATTKFDVLIVNDVITKGNYELNPYLPSKVSDYLGSNSDIWALYETESTISKMDFKYKSDINDYDDCLNQLVQILKDYGFDDENYSITKDYFNNRLTKLNELYEYEYKQKIKVKKNLNNLKKENKTVNSNSSKISKLLRKLSD